MTKPSTDNLGNQEQRPIMLLFMGRTDEHAITSFQHFYPCSVHIITSDKFQSKYEKLVKKWSDEYSFRGQVHAIDDLFLPSSVNSLFTAAFSAIDHEIKTHSSSDHNLEFPVLFGVTGGTMHMAVAGTYLSQIIGGAVFYVLRPPEGKEPIPARDIMMFPELSSIRTALQTLTPDIHFLMSKREGELDTMFEDSNINDIHLSRLVEQGLVSITEGNWKVTDLGAASFDFVANSMLWNEFHHFLSSKAKSTSSDDMMHA